MTLSLRAALPVLLLGLATGSHAATTLIDNTTLNGSFENGTGTTTITSWSVAPGNAIIERKNDNAQNGGWSLVVGRNSSGGLSGVAVNTGYSIATGDVFDLSFSLRGALNAEATDQVAWSLFYTSDNTLGGTQTQLFSGSNALTGATGLLATSPYNPTGTLSSGAAHLAASGKTLFLSITAGSGFTNDEFARIDSVALSVTSVPEPSLPVMAGLAAITLSVIRRRPL
ncbi:hypothetical protein OKA05_16080 [Luteolibacter arcticus]|uniref:PEP-CTERM sorting domain-containing protein n=1 Tax=Luteolibacter arcticus TaxID=1581411 RepID=A0ABT3GKV1_9BACT|nr:hypothetical protein [Luteolibacter arcticus]MCW1924086.1 hypothetical protein [Luteolibacter arcticus]